MANDKDIKIAEPGTPRKRLTYAEAMTLMKGLLLGYHEQFVLPYVDERSKLVQVMVDKRLRELFPEKFETVTEVEEPQPDA